MDDASALIRTAVAGDAESLRRLLLGLQRPFRLTAAIFLPTQREVDAVVLRWGAAVANTLSAVPLVDPIPWLRQRLRDLIAQRLDELDRSPGFSGDPLLRLLIASGRERLATVPVEADPVSALAGRVRLMSKGATDLLTLRFTDGASFAQIAEQRRLSLDDLSMAVQTACRQLDWTGDASGGALEPADYRAIDGLICGSNSAVEGLGALRGRLLDDMGLALRAVRAARWHLIAAAWHAPELVVEIPSTFRPPAPAPLTTARRATSPQPGSRALKSRGLSTPTRRQLAHRDEGDQTAASLEEYPDHQPRSGLIPTLIGGALVISGVALWFLRGGTVEMPPAPESAPPPATAPITTTTTTGQTTPMPTATTNKPPASTPPIAPVMAPVPALFTSALSPAPLTAWSTRRLVTAYDGPLLRVRRSSDHVESDIGAFADGALDTTTLTRFTTTSSAHVVCWYDQSGNNHHLRQAERDRQPRIVRDGELAVENSRPVIVFERSRFEHLTTPAGIPIGCLYALVKVVSQPGATQAIMGSLAQSSNESEAYYPIVDREGKGECEWWVGQTKDYSMIKVGIARDRLLLWHSASDGKPRPKLTLRHDGKEVAQVTASHEALIPTGPTIVGAGYWARQPGDPFGGSLGELVVLPPGSTREVRGTITKDLKSWWKIP